MIVTLVQAKTGTGLGKQLLYKDKQKTELKPMRCVKNLNLYYIVACKNVFLEAFLKHTI